MPSKMIIATSALAIALLSGCSSTTTTPETSPSAAESASESTAPAGSETFSDTTYGYSFQYGPPFEEKGDPTFAGSGGSDTTATGAVFDTSAKPINGQYRTAFLVNVYELGQEITEADLPAVKEQLESTVIPQLKQSAPDIEVAPLTETTLAGAPAFQTEVNLTLDGTPSKSQMYFVFSGDTEYQVMAQAPNDEWTQLQSQFDAMFNSFTITK